MLEPALCPGWTRHRRLVYILHRRALEPRPVIIGHWTLYGSLWGGKQASGDRPLILRPLSTWTPKRTTTITHLSTVTLKGCTNIHTLKIPHHAILGLITAFGGTTRIGFHACMLEIPLIILTLFITEKTASASFKNVNVKTLLPSSSLLWLVSTPTLLRLVDFAHVSSNSQPGESCKHYLQLGGGTCVLQPRPLHSLTSHCYSCGAF